MCECLLFLRSIVLSGRLLNKDEFGHSHSRLLIQYLICLHSSSIETKYIEVES